jgi:hypothetical protein
MHVSDYVITWFSGEEKPVRSGVYRRSNGNIAMWSYWDQRSCLWFAGSDKHYEAVLTMLKSVNQEWPWGAISKEQLGTPPKV